MKTHLVPIAAGRRFAMCSARVPDDAPQVATRAEFNALPTEKRCGSCNAAVNGRPTTIGGTTRVILSHELALSLIRRRHRDNSN